MKALDTKLSTLINTNFETNNKDIDSTKEFLNQKIVDKSDGIYKYIKPILEDINVNIEHINSQLNNEMSELRQLKLNTKRTVLKEVEAF